MESFLLHPSTIKNRYSNIGGKPGFTKESFNTLKRYTSKGTIIVCNLVIDEMPIREQLIFDGKSFCGGADLGTDMPNENADNVTLAKSALVFMAVGIITFWKLPLGYFLVKALNGNERAQHLVKMPRVITYQ